MHEQSLRKLSMVFLQMRAGSMYVRTPMRRHLSLLFFLCLLLSAICTACSPLFGEQTASGPLRVQGLPRARLTYVALGASDTYGIGTNDPATKNWAADLAAKLGSGVHLVNLGVPDIKTHDALTAELPVALDAHPDLITIWLAVNDLAAHVPVASYAQDLEQLVMRLQTAFPHARIAVANVPDLTLIPYFHSSSFQNASYQGSAVSSQETSSVEGTLASIYEPPQQQLQDQISVYNSNIAAIVSRHHILLVDLYQQWSTLKDHPEYISKDGLHPTAVGYAQIAGLFYQTLQKSSS